MIRLRRCLAVITIAALVVTTVPVFGTAFDAFAEEETVAQEAESTENEAEETLATENLAEENPAAAESTVPVPEDGVSSEEESRQDVSEQDPAAIEAQSTEPVETKLESVSTKHSKSYKSTIGDTITISPAYGRTVELYLYDSYLAKWTLQKTYTSANQAKADVTITYPNTWKAYSESTWKIVCPGNESYQAASQTVKITNKIANAKAAVVIDAQTGEVIYAQNARKHLKIASMTKMVTMMVVIDKGKYGKKVKITSEAVKARKKSGGMGLVKGDKVRMKDLVHATLMESANDAAAAAACGVSGNQKKFAVLMKEKARSIGATESTFQYAYGDWHSNTYSTAYDQALIGREFMTNPKYSQLRTIVKKRTYKFKTKKKKKRYTVRMGGMSTSLIKNGRSIGIKSGYNPPAGYCYANAWKYKGKMYISIVMGASSSSKLVSSQKALMSFSDYAVDHQGARIKVK